LLNFKDANKSRVVHSCTHYLEFFYSQMTQYGRWHLLYCVKVMTDLPLTNRCNEIWYGICLTIIFLQDLKFRIVIVNPAGLFMLGW